MTKNTLAATLAALAALTLTGTVQAQSAMSHPKMSSGSMMHDKMSGKMMHGTMMSKKMVAYCAECKMYYSKSDAKKMSMKDGMGHKMAMVPMSKVPKGTMMGHMSGGKMMDHKM